MSIYFLPVGIQRKRLQIMHKLASKLDLAVVSNYDRNVDYVVTELENHEMASKALHLKEHSRIFLSTLWFFDSVKIGHVLPGSMYVLQKSEDIAISPKANSERYLCQKPTLLYHKNTRFVRALEKLAEEAELKLGKEEPSRALAFRKAAGALKQLPNEIQKIEELDRLTDIGTHSRSVVREILEESVSKEVLRVETSEWFKTVKLFSSVYGVGATKANSWYEMGLRTLQDLSHSNIKLDDRTKYGLRFHQDLSNPVSKLEADRILNLVSCEIQDLLPGTLVYLMGGFRRGKETGHDVDILISHPHSGKEDGLLHKLCRKLGTRGLILHQTMDHRKTKPTPDKRSTIDNFEKRFLIFKLPEESNITCDEPGRNWHARRVDLILCPFQELPFAIVGWTGNKMFNRSLRLYAKREMNMNLTSHGLYDLANNIVISVSSEEEIFEKLNLPFLRPHERNL